MKHIDLIPLNKAVNCENCQQVSASTRTCVGCGSSALVLLSRLVNRSEEPTTSAIDDLMAMVERQMANL